MQNSHSLTFKMETKAYNKGREEMRIRLRRYLIGAEIGGEIDYKIVFTKHAIKYNHDFLADNIPRKPDFIIELPTTKSELEQFLEKYKEKKK